MYCLMYHQIAINNAITINKNASKIYKFCKKVKYIDI